jgi:phosphoribosylformimino-5-aminoimidazole carboxamide ribotide isomerase
VCNQAPGARFIASGGVGDATHIEMLMKLNQTNLEGVIVGKALYDGRVSFRELTQIVEKQVRPNE